MATLKLRRFCNPDTLRAIDPNRLATFLGRFAAYFDGRGLQLSTGTVLNYDRLVAVLMTPDETIPAGLAGC